MKRQLALPVFLMTVSCLFRDDTPYTGTDHETETGTGNYSIYLKGRVIDKTGPVDNVVARLSRMGISDTTGADGVYIIKKKEGNGALKKPGGEVLDTLVLEREKQVIQTLDIRKWIDTLPDIFIVRQNISGNLEKTDKRIGKVEVVLTGDGIPESVPYKKEISYSEEKDEYSGTLFFPQTGENRNFVVNVYVYDDEGRFIGRSSSHEFNSLEGNIKIDSFNPTNALPVAYAGRDTTVSINDTIHLHGSAAGAFGGKAVKWEWNINETGFIVTSSGDTSIQVPGQSSDGFRCVLRISDTDGNIAQDTVMIIIIQDPPEVSISVDAAPVLNRPVTFKATVSQKFGNIVQYRWDNGMEPGFDDSTGSEYTFIYPVPNSYNITVEAEDDDGNKSSATTNVRISPEAALDSIPKLKKVLVSNFFFGYHHNTGRALNIALIKQIGMEEGFKVEVVGKNEEFTPDKLDSAQVLVLQNLTGAKHINEPMKTAIIKWVEEGGGGILAINATMDGSKGEWDWLQDNCLYGHYLPHSKIVPATILIDNEAYDDKGNLHPILQGIGPYPGVDLNNGTITGWTEEWMNWNNVFRGATNLKILLSMDLTSYDCNCKLTDHPALWVTEPVGKGRTAYFLVGHGEEIHECKLAEYENNAGKECNQLLKHLFRNIIIYMSGSKP